MAHNLVVRARSAGIRLTLIPQELEGTAQAVNTVFGTASCAATATGSFVLDTAQNTLIEDNLALASEDDGLDVDTPSTTLTGNHARHNGDLGIEPVFGVIDGGRNTGRRNGNPVQCMDLARIAAQARSGSRRACTSAVSSPCTVVCEPYQSAPGASRNAGRFHHVD